MLHCPGGGTNYNTEMTQALKRTGEQDGESKQVGGELHRRQTAVMREDVRPVRGHIWTRAEFITGPRHVGGCLCFEQPASVMQNAQEGGGLK